MSRRTTLLGLVLVCALVAGPVLAGAPAPVSYDGHKVVRVDLQSRAELETLLGISPDIWSDYIGVGPLEARIPPDKLAALAASGLTYEVLVDDLGPASRRHLAQGLTRDDWDHYMDLGQLTTFINDLATARPDLCEVFSIGTSVQSRDIWVLHITGTGSSPKPAVFYHALIHCREWLTAPVVLYLADYLVSNYDTNPDVAALVDGLDIYLAPCVNPDGYVYTWMSDRYWRKNRAYYSGYYGVDLNRNWGYQWGYDNEGSSPNPWDLTYRGPSAFSEPETQALRDFIIAHPDILAYMDYHTFSQLILWPWGYDCFGGPPEPDRTMFQTVGTTMRSLILGVHGVSYTAGPICETIYAANGGSVDWAYGARDIFAFTIELRPATGGNEGFSPPPTEILPTCQENLPAILHLTQWALDQVGTTISLPSGLPAALLPGQPNTIDVDVVSLYETTVPGSPTVYYRYDGGVFASAPLTHVSGTLYQATLTPPNCAAVPQFYFSAEGSGSGVVYAPDNAPTTTYAVPVGEFVTVFADDFEANLGWTVQNSTSPALTDGGWDRGVPVNCDRGDPPTDYDGSGQCYLTDNSAASSCNSDVDGGYTWLMSPTINLSTGDAYVYYALWYTNDYGSDPDNDLFKTYVSNNNGSTWVLAETIGPQTSSGWTPHSFRVGQFVTPTAQVKVRFEASDLGSGSVVEAGIDAFSVQRLECTDPQTGACCFADGSCSVTEQAACTGTWQGAGTVCDPNPCPQPQGACCFADGSCSVTEQAACTGTWQGAGTVCDPNPCPQPQGACCFADGSCSVTEQAACTGTWQGAGTVCDPNPCPQPWCLGDMDCSGGSPTFDDIKYFSAAVGSESGWWAHYRAMNGGADPPCPWLLGDYSAPQNGVEFSDIKPFAASIGQPCIPYVR